MRLNKLILILVILFCFQPVFGQQPKKGELPIMRVLSKEKRPDLAIEYSRVARFKVASHKQTYHIGELISLDMAVLNISEKPIFFAKISQPQFYLYDDQGQEQKVVPYIIVCLAINIDSFELLEPKIMTLESMQLLLGCDDRPFNQINDGSDDKDDKRVFENNQFINYGRACLNIRKPGTYTIKARLRNDHVVESVDDPNVKTAVGAIESELLTIKVID
jgi:hypothetical protein